MPNEKTYDNVEELIKDMIDTGIGPDYPDGYINWMNFNGSFFKGVEDQKPDFWQKLVAYMKLNAPTLEKDFKYDPEKISSVFYYINEKADIDKDNGDIWQKIVSIMTPENIDLSTPSGIKEPSKSYFWNESLSHLIAEYMKNFNSDVELHGASSIPMSAIKNADAGYDFQKDWVLPTYNIDVRDHDGTLRGDSYEEVRGADAIKSVLMNSNEMQFTREQKVGEIGWLRLIMPKYLRKVEVEDLNRNFWVIAQTLSAVCAYLFGENSIKNLLEGILKELVGLWENCLYLWAATALISQKDKITDIHVEFAPLTNSEIYGYRKFDNFGETYTDIHSEIKERMDYLIQVYSNSNIIIIPEIRGENYKHNYYSRVEYPGMMVYNRNTGNQTWVNFIVDEPYRMETKHLAIDLIEDFNNMESIYVDKIGAITENEIVYNFKQKFSNILDAEDEWETIQEYKSERTAAEGLQASMGIDYKINTVHGNINMDDREILYNERGQIETVLGSWQEFPASDFITGDTRYFVVCFSPLKQTGTGTPENVEDTVISYLTDLISSISSELTTSTTSEEFCHALLNADENRDKLVAYAQIVSTQPHDDDDTYSGKLSQVLHLIGRYGSVLLLEQDVLQDATRTGYPLSYLISPDMTEQKFAAAYNKAVPYYAAIRTRIPTFSAEYNSENDKIEITGIRIQFYDAAAQAIDGKEYKICTFLTSDNLEIGSQEEVNMNFSYLRGEDCKSGTLPSAADIPIKYGYYMGELVSSQPIIKAKEYSFDLKEFHGQQLFSATPNDILKIMGGE